MPTLTAPRNAILAPLQAVSGVIARSSTLPILANVLLKRSTTGVVSFLASNTEIQLTTSTSFGSEDDDFGETLEAKKLVDILRALPNDAEVKLKFDGSKATLQSGRSRFTLQTLPAEDFPTISVPERFDASFELPASVLSRLLHSVSFASAAQDIRYYLNGVLLELDGANVRAVATDGHRMAVCEAKVEGEGLEPRQAIIPGKTVAELLRLLDADSDDSVSIGMNGTQASFEFGNVAMVSKLIEGKFPDYQRVIPKDNPNIMTCNREALAGALDRAAIMTGDKFKGVRLSLADGMLRVNAVNAEQEEAAVEVEIGYQGEAVEMGVNVDYLQDVLAVHKSADSVSMALKDGTTSALIRFDSDDDFRYVVMPMRI